ncbi:tail protein X [Psychrobacter urativorans]|uniref:Phage tail protein n=1 Tax=Psychrobacter urativorans TaxID=45610 RepID=A0A0M4SYX6_9GAMM|nr:tail protein X [Psychrobacter urativorans]ALF60335.1 hypothetical protein AOC03_10025 [Psychrobacter urativorans]
MSPAQYQRTILAIQNDTLDAIAYRIYANRSIDMLPKLIESNPDYSPIALLPTDAVVILPNDHAAVAAPSIKLWD